LRQLRREGHTFEEDAIVVSCNPEIADILVTIEQQYLDELEKRLQKKLMIEAKKRFHHEKFEIRGRASSRPAEAPPQEDSAT
jgi:Ribonuclease G/E